MLKPAAVSMRAATLQCYHTCASKLTLLAVQAAAMATYGPMAYIWAADLWHPRKCSEFSTHQPVLGVRGIGAKCVNGHQMGA